MIKAPELARISSIVQETPTVKTFTLEKEINGNPGQFAMLWLPGVDEKPFSVSQFGKQVKVSIQKKGKFTEKCFELKEGDFIGIRGPFGKGFNLEKVKKAIVIGGGCGTAAVAPLPKALKEKGIEFVSITGAKNESELFSQESFTGFGELVECTDDGSKGRKGFVTEALEELLQKKEFDTVLACGPEIMLLKVFEACEASKVECQLSLERFMKCGLGVCAQCVIDNQLVCKDGPVFNSAQIRKLSEFGKFARLKSGEKVELKEYYAWRQK